VSFGKGRLTGMTDPSGATVYHYDALGRTVREEATILGVSYTTQYAYDNVGNLETLTYPGGRVVTTAFDALRRPTQIDATLNGSATTLAGSFAYDNVSNLTAFTPGNGLTQRYRYDAANRLAGIDAPNVMGLSFRHDPVGGIVSMWDNAVASQVPGTERTVNYTYLANRLQSVTEDNVTRFYAYDNTGNTTSDGIRTFVYNLNQRLIEAWQGGSKRGEYVYDGKGRRVIKTANGVTTVYHYDLGNRLIAETDGAGNPIVDYVWLGDGPLAQIRNAGTTEAAYYYHNDHLGTSKAMTDNTQTVVWRVETDPFGNEIGNSVKIVENNLRFPGQYYDQETGLNQNYFRDYDSTLGRYIEADPIGLKGGFNLFGYANGSPVNLYDRNGLSASSKCCPDEKEKDVIRKRIKIIENILNSNKVSPDDPNKIMAETSCHSLFSFNFPFTTRGPNFPLSPCLRECVMAHENVHQGQCSKYGSTYYDNVSNRNSLEREGYMAELNCLRIKL
jgi:RHS repeat-associated protein